MSSARRARAAAGSSEAAMSNTECPMSKGSGSGHGEAGESVATPFASAWGPGRGVRPCHLSFRASTAGSGRPGRSDHALGPPISRSARTTCGPVFLGDKRGANQEIGTPLSVACGRVGATLLPTAARALRALPGARLAAPGGTAAGWCASGASATIAKFFHTVHCLQEGEGSDPVGKGQDTIARIDDPSL